MIGDNKWENALFFALIGAIVVLVLALAALIVSTVILGYNPLHHYDGTTVINNR